MLPFFSDAFKILGFLPLIFSNFTKFYLGMLSLHLSWNSWICYFAIFFISFGKSKDMSLSKLWELVMEREVWHDAVHGITKSRTWLSDWTELFHSNEICCLLNTLNIFPGPGPPAFWFTVKKSQVINWLHIWGTSKFWPIMPAIKWFSVSVSSKGVSLTRPSPVLQSVPRIKKYNEEKKKNSWLWSAYLEWSLLSEILIHWNECWYLLKYDIL